MKQSVEIELPEKSEAFERQQYLKKYRGITKVYVVTNTKLRVYYDPQRMTVKRIIELSKSNKKPIIL